MCHMVANRPVNLRTVRKNLTQNDLSVKFREDIGCP